MVKNLNQEFFAENEPGIHAFARNFVAGYSLTDKNCLEVGMGWGAFTHHILQRGARVVGTEISENDLLTAKSDDRLKQANLLVADGLTLPFPDGTFDFVFAWEVLEHIPKNTEKVFFKEMFRVLKAEGIFVMSTPHKNFRSIIFDPAFWIIGHRHYSQKQLNEYGEISGFKNSKFEVRGKYFLALWHISIYISKWILRKNNMLDFPWFVSKLRGEEYVQRGWMGIFAEFKKVA
jgi:SAM-dependent methyltransferase